MKVRYVTILNPSGLLLPLDVEINKVSLLALLPNLGVGILHLVRIGNTRQGAGQTLGAGRLLKCGFLREGSRLPDWGVGRGG